MLRPLLDAIDGVTPPATRSDRTHTFMLYSLLVDGDRDALRERLLDDGIEARLYFPPVHRQPIFAAERVDLPVTDHLAAHLLSIPFHSRLEPSELAELAVLTARHLKA